MRHSLLFVFVALLAACSGSDPVSPASQPVGTYTLTQVNGTSLPTTVFQNTAGKVEVASGTLVLRADKSYTETRINKVTYTAGGTDNSTIVENGTYSITGSQMTFSIAASGSQSALSFTGAIGGGSVTYTWNGVAYRYTR